MGVIGTRGTPPLPGCNNYKVLAASAKKVGYKSFHSGNMAINSQPRDGRGSCQQICFCFQGCKSGAKWSTLYTEIPKGEKTGRLEVRPDAQALKIEHDKSGRVTGVMYADSKGNRSLQKARVACVAGNRGAYCSTRRRRCSRTASRIPPAKSAKITKVPRIASFRPRLPMP
jgi:hypothetical protein